MLLKLYGYGDALENTAASSAKMAREELNFDLPGSDPLSCGNDGCGASGEEYARVRTHFMQQAFH
jgi:hypothetical protein